MKNKLIYITIYAALIGCHQNKTDDNTLDYYEIDSLQYKSYLTMCEKTVFFLYFYNYDYDCFDVQRINLNRKIQTLPVAITNINSVVNSSFDTIMEFSLELQVNKNLCVYKKRVDNSFVSLPCIIGFFKKDNNLAYVIYNNNIKVLPDRSNIVFIKNERTNRLKLIEKDYYKLPSSFIYLYNKYKNDSLTYWYW